MYNYDPKSLKAEEFINHEEIEETLRYAEENKHNAELIDSILEKARLRKGLSHREAEVLLDCDIPEKNEEIYKLAEQIKKDFYGNRIVMFAPLYLSNYCVNGCVYCPYHLKNKHIARIKLTQEQVRQEVIALQDMGHKRLAIEAGEDPVHNPIEYILECIKTIYSVHHKNGDIRRVNVNIAATTVETIGNLRMPASERTSCFRKHTIKRAILNFIRRDRSTTMITIPRQWTEQWKAALMTSDSVFCLDWRVINMNLQGC